jgi:putative ABC transport system substrate-binding protein
MNRRSALVAIVALGTPVAAVAQGAKSPPVARIGRLSPLSAETDAPALAAFRSGMRDLGWIEGRDFVIETRYADGIAERLPGLAAQLARQRVDLILAGSNPGTLAAKRAMSAIPVVMVTTGDPVAGGLVASLAQPGGNVTGLTALGMALSAKRLALLKEAVPGVERIAVLTRGAGPSHDQFVQERDELARGLGVRLQLVEARDVSGFERAFAEMRRERAGALMALSDALFITNRTRLVQLAAQNRVPAVYPEFEFVSAGGLMFYGASLADQYHRAAAYADKILKGMKPAELPVEQPTKLELAINRKTAHALGLAIPSTLLVRADHVIE